MDLHSVMDILKLKMPLIVIIMVEILFLILLILYRLDLIELKTLVTLVVVEILVLVLGYLLGERSDARRIKIEEESKQKEKLEQELNKETVCENEKRIVSGRLLSEIYRNQKLLKPLSDTVAKVMESYDDLSKYIKIPTELNFNISIYSESSNKLGLLDNENREIIDNYYLELKYIENEYKKFEIIHGHSHVHLFYILTNFEFKEKLGQLNINYNSPGRYEIEEFLRHTKKVYDLGTDLIISMKDK